MKWQTLAPELIFEVLSQFRADFETLSVTKPYSFPWYLGHTCRVWREVFVSSPQFWNTLSINLSFSSWFGLIEEQGWPGWEEQALEVARISLVRSRDAPISFRLSVDGYSQASPAEITLCRRMTEILVAHSAHWRDAHIYIPADEMATIYAAKNRMPLLRSIRLELDDTTVRSCDAAKLYSDFLEDATHLTRICFVDNSTFWKINWSSITVIHFNTVPPLSQLLSYLSQMPYLMELVFPLPCYFEGDETLHDGIVPITLPHLKFLYSLTVTPLLIVKTPALQELQIQNYTNDSALKTIISRYFQPIHHLSKLEIFTYGWKDAALIIEHMPQVNHLTLNSDTPADLLQILEDYPQMGFLKTVTFTLFRRSEEDTDCLLETITSWKRETGENRGIGPFHNLTEMSFKLWNSFHQQFIDRLKLHLEEQGMCYSIDDSENLSGYIPCLMAPRFGVL